MIAAAMLAVVSCGKEASAPETKAPVFSLAVSQEAVPADKAELTPSDKIQWSANDALSILFGAENLEYTADAAGYSTTFSGSAAPTSFPAYAVYPYNASNFLDAGDVYVTVPAEQHPVPGSFDPDAAVLIGEIEMEDGQNSGKVTLYNVCSYLAITLSEGNVMSVTIENPAGEAIAGEVALAYSKNPAVSYESAPESTIVLTPSGSSFFPAGTYYVAMLPCANTNGLTITFKKLTRRGILTGSCEIASYETRRAHIIPLGDRLASVTAWTPEAGAVTSKTVEFILHDGSAWNPNYDSALGDVWTTSGATTAVDAGKYFRFVINDTHYAFTTYATTGYHKHGARGGGIVGMGSYVEGPAIYGMKTTSVAFTNGYKGYSKPAVFNSAGVQVSDATVITGVNTGNAVTWTIDTLAYGLPYRLQTTETGSGAWAANGLQFRKVTFTYSGTEYPSPMHVSNPSVAAGGITSNYVMNAVATEAFVTYEIKASASPDIVASVKAECSSGTATASVPSLPAGNYQVRAALSSNGGVDNIYSLEWADFTID